MLLITLQLMNIPGLKKNIKSDHSLAGPVTVSPMQAAHVQVLLCLL
jgi:hypothetical protein